MLAGQVGAVLEVPSDAKRFCVAAKTSALRGRNEFFAVTFIANFRFAPSCVLDQKNKQLEGFSGRGKANGYSGMC